MIPPPPELQIPAADLTVDAFFGMAAAFGLGLLALGIRALLTQAKSAGQASGQRRPTGRERAPNRL